MGLGLAVREHRSGDVRGVAAVHVVPRPRQDAEFCLGEDPGKKFGDSSGCAG